MKVLENHQRRLLGSDTGDEVGKTIEQMTPRLGGRQIERRRKLRQDVLELWQQARQLPPLVAEGRAQHVEVRDAVCEVLEDFDEWQISDGFIVLRAMPDQQSDSFCLSSSRDFIGETRFADAGFAGNQEQLPSPVSRRVEPAKQGGNLPLSSHY